ncbi:MAG: hypothetical protein LBB19_00255 [Puniceicoccales bacterium]|jgi:biotin synthase|nr:hypothetical protein [Puniceicoccales bacterium]
MEDRIDMFLSTRKLNIQSVPVNLPNPIPGTPYAHNKILANDEMCRIIALARFLLPKTSIRMAGGRRLLPDNGRQCFLSGANAAVSGNVPNDAEYSDRAKCQIVDRIGIHHRIKNIYIGARK